MTHGIQEWRLFLSRRCLPSLTSDEQLCALCRCALDASAPFYSWKPLPTRSSSAQRFFAHVDCVESPPPHLRMRPSSISRQLELPSLVLPSVRSAWRDVASALLSGVDSTDELRRAHLEERQTRFCRPGLSVCDIARAPEGFNG